MKKNILLLTILTFLSSVAFSSSAIIYAQTTATPTATNKQLQQEQNQQTRMQNIKTKADGYITQRLASINAFTSYIMGTKVATSNQAQTVLASLVTDSSGLIKLKSQIDAFSDGANIKTGLLPLVQEVFTSYRVYAIEIPKDHLLLHVAFVNNLNTNYTTAQQNIAQDITYAQGQGKNVTTLQADSTKYATDVAKFNTDLQAAQSALAAITPASYQQGVKIFAGVNADFATVHTDVQAIQSDFAQFIKDFKASFGM